MVRILLGSCGGLTGIYLARQYRDKESLYVVGSDCSDMNAGKFFVDDFILLPRANDSCFIDVLGDVLRQKGIDYYIPTYSAEIKVVAQFEEKLRSVAPATSFVTCPYETFQALDDKEKMYNSFLSAGIPVPKLFRDADSVDAFPCFMKRRVGSGGAGSSLVNSWQTCSALSADYPDALFFEYIDGNELTIDCMFDMDGNLVSYNQRKRIKTLGGAVIVSENDFSTDIEPYLYRIASSWLFRGCVNFQCIVRDGVPVFTDVNLRFPSGGLPLTVESGIDIPQMLLDMLAGRDFGPGPIASDRRPRVMYRYFEELFASE